MINGVVKGAESFDQIAHSFLKATRATGLSGDGCLASATAIDKCEEQSAFTGWHWVPPKKMRASGTHTVGYLRKENRICVKDEVVCRCLAVDTQSLSSESDEYSMEDEDESCAATSLDSSTCILRVTYSIAFHVIYRVPVMCFRFTTMDGCPINLMGTNHSANPLVLAARILTPPSPAKPKASLPSPPASSVNRLDGGHGKHATTVPTSAAHTVQVAGPSSHRIGSASEITVDNHPADGLPCFAIHPCQTNDAMQELRGDCLSSSESPSSPHSLYLLRWLCLVSPLVGLRCAAADYVRLSTILSGRRQTAPKPAGCIHVDTNTSIKNKT